MEKDLEQEYDAAAKLIPEGCECLCIALSKDYMGKVTVGTALIDSAKKKDGCCSGEGRSLVIETKGSQWKERCYCEEAQEE